MIQRVATIGMKLAATSTAHPLTTASVSITASVVAVLQSAQTIAGTLIALVSSITSLVVAVMALRGAFKDKDK